jgi:Holliday junction resolvase RusA-like endonuclease
MSAATISQITLDLPIPPSVNALRRVDWANNAKRQRYYLHADLHISAYGPKPAPVRIICRPFEVTIQIPEQGPRIDLDNHCKCLLDYLVSREFIPDDNRARLRRLVVEFSQQIQACRVLITELSTD